MNGLKKINDTLGHKAGDEFVVLLQGRDYDSRAEIMKNINVKIEENIGAEKVVMSLGLADFDPENDKTFHEVFKHADGHYKGRFTDLENQ